MPHGGHQILTAHCSPPIWIISAACGAWSRRRARGFSCRPPDSRWYHEQFPGSTLAAMTGEHVLALVQHLLSLSANDYTGPRQPRIFGHSFVSCAGPGSTAKILPGSFRGHRAGACAPAAAARMGGYSACDRRDRRDDAVGVRDRALMLLLATTGLRNKEIRALELRGYPLANRGSLVRRTKGKRDRVVPLLKEAGGRRLQTISCMPGRRSTVRECSCRMRRRSARFSSSGAISRIVRSTIGTKRDRAFRRRRRAFVAPQPGDTTRQATAPINEVADLLGHRSIDTTAIYVKVALPQLADVALPFPGDAS